MTEADKFWETYKIKDNTRSHLCDIPKEIFYARHKNALALFPEYPANEIGLLIAAKYYSDVWSSRSCSGYLAYLVDIGNRDGDGYMEFYCSSSCYFFLKDNTNPTYQAFIKADELDNRMG
jgi:hypothetical protein